MQRMTTFGRWARFLVPVTLLAAVMLPGQAAAKTAVLRVCLRGCGYSTVQAAVDAAPDGATITIAAGAYVGAIDTERKDLTLSGAGARQTILRGDGTVGYGLHVYGGTTVSVSGVTLTGTNSDIYDAVLNEGTLTFKNTVITNNSTSFGGPTIWSDSGSLTLQDSAVTNNTATNSQDGTIFIGGTSLTLNDSVVSNNTTTGDGGAIENAGNGSLLTLKDSILSNNSASGPGGGLDNLAPNTALISDSTILGNTALIGGGIYNDSGGTSVPGLNPGGTVTLTDTLVAGNTATGGQGSGIFNSKASAINPGLLTLNNSWIILNHPAADQCDGCS